MSDRNLSNLVEQGTDSWMELEALEVVVIII